MSGKPGARIRQFTEDGGVERAPPSGFDLSVARAAAFEAARFWGVEVGTPFAFSNVSFVAPVNNHEVVKVAWEGDDESLHEGDALELWNGDAAVRLLRRHGRALLIQRAVPGDDISDLGDEQATAAATAVATQIWRPATPPFRPVEPEVGRWLDRAEAEGSVLVPLARDLLAELNPTADWVVHGDFHHHNILRDSDRFVAIDPKPYLAEREYDVPPFLWNPWNNRLEDRASTERRIAAFVALGLDEFRIRAWTVIRGAYLRSEPQYADRLRALLSQQT
jgi:streptomycin 6-kinase